MVQQGFLECNEALIDFGMAGRHMRTRLLLTVSTLVDNLRISKVNKYFSNIFNEEKNCLADMPLLRRTF